jgi:hypothetical protein
VYDNTNTAPETTTTTAKKGCAMITMYGWSTTWRRCG